MENKIQETTNQEKARVAILISSDKVHFIRKSVIKNKEGYFIMIKESAQWENTTVLNVCASNGQPSKYIK